MADGRVVLVIDVPQIIQETIKTKSDTVYGEPIVARQKRDTKRISMRKKKDTQKIIEDRKPSILVVDDSLSVRKYLNGLLSEKGFSILTAKNGLEGLNLLKDKKFDLIITDLEMPQVSGYELIETIRSDEQHNETPIIVLTGRASEDFRNLTTELGANAYIIKPFKDQELFDEIEQHIRFNK
jgi:chemosensory pili system protein ChpA (sensor histidine kinase/response regulator)